MDDVSKSFGQQINQQTSLSKLIQLEKKENRQNIFTSLDVLIGDLIVRILQGQSILTKTPKRLNENTITLSGLTDEQRKFVDDTFHIKHQQSRGAWFVPESANLKIGMMSLPAFFKQHSRFGSGIAKEENGKYALKNSPDLILIWAILEPLFSTLFLPFDIRGNQTGTLSREEQLKSWLEIDKLYETLGFSVSEQLAQMRYSGGWHKLRAYAQLEAKLGLLAALANQVTPIIGVNYRAYRIRELVEQYYKKAKTQKYAKRKQVLTKSFESTLSGYFGGDWRLFLDYIGEQPHPEEEIVTALPKTQLQVGSSARMEEIAKQQGLSTEEVQRIAATYWQQPLSKSPVEQRVELLTEYWNTFDEIHAQQKTGMRSLWGLIEEGGFLNFSNHLEHFNPFLYLELLPQNIRSEIESLWGTILLPQWPEHIVSEPFPHALMAKTLGPALKFWNGCALTAWFLCEGPYSRTNMAGLENYYKKEIALLQSLGTPINQALFNELIKAEDTLGTPEPIQRQSSSVETIHGISLSITTSSGSRRSGFEKLRDIITVHRRTWTAQYYHDYIKALWEFEIGETAQTYNMMLNKKGKPPTLKQFVKAAESPTNHWFGGNINGLYGAIRERSPVEPIYKPIMPSDRIGFARLVFKNLGGKPYDHQLAFKEPQTDQSGKYASLANLSFRYVQLEEIRGHPPTLQEFGVKKFENPGSILSKNQEEAWSIFSQVIEKSK